MKKIGIPARICHKFETLAHTNGQPTESRTDKERGTVYST